jgi:hypothetical protein
LSLRRPSVFLLLPLALCLGQSAARAESWTVSLPSLDGTYESWSATTDGPVEHVIEIPVDVPANVTVIRGATLGATLQRNDGIVRCCFGEPDPCSRSPETPWVGFAIDTPEGCGDRFFSAENTFLVDGEPLGEWWFGSFQPIGTSDCGEGFDYLREDPVLTLRIRVGTNPFILACDWYEPASVDLTGLAISFDVDRVVDGDASSWGAVKALMGGG